jgi:hypothetical protein
MHCLCRNQITKCPFYHKKNSLPFPGTLPLSNSSWSTVIYIVNNVDFVYIYYYIYIFVM